MDDIKIWRASEGIAAVRASPDLDVIFFTSSATQAFTDAAERAAFRDRWLGRYLDNWSENFWVASANGRLIGYLAGCLIDPLTLPLFDDHAFLRAFALLTPAYPAHLHINVDATRRSGGVGAALIAAFCEDASRSGSRGVHVVTAAASRNVSFYARQDFVQVGAANWSGRDLVMLGRRL